MTPCGTLDDIEHVIFLVQENRSFDHYFGTYRGVSRGSPTRARSRACSTSRAIRSPRPTVDELLPFHINAPQHGPVHT